jgi:hypothetical protein
MVVVVVADAGAETVAVVAVGAAQIVRAVEDGIGLAVVVLVDAAVRVVDVAFAFVADAASGPLGQAQIS